MLKAHREENGQSPICQDGCPALIPRVPYQSHLCIDRHPSPHVITAVCQMWQCRQGNVHKHMEYTWDRNSGSLNGSPAALIWPGYESLCGQRWSSLGFTAKRAMTLCSLRTVADSSSCPDICGTEQVLLQDHSGALCHHCPNPHAQRWYENHNLKWKKREGVF